MESDRQNCMSWLVSCSLIRMQISCIEKHLGAHILPSPLSTPHLPFHLFSSSAKSSSLLSTFPSLLSCPIFSHSASFISSPLTLTSFWFYLTLTSSSALNPAFTLLFLFGKCLVSCPVSSPPLSVCQSELSFIPSFHFIQLKTGRFTWSLSVGLCRPEEDLTGGCMFRLVWILFQCLLQHTKTAEWERLLLCLSK